jgi:hypothetical protein
MAIITLITEKIMSRIIKDEKIKVAVLGTLIGEKNV